MKNELRFLRDNRLGFWNIITAFTFMTVGALFGMLQALVRSGAMSVPTSGISYYQYLTAHGILMAIVFTTFFIMGFLLTGTGRVVGGLPPLARTLGWVGYWIMLLSTVAVTVEVLRNTSTVLYTFYAPMQASTIFYLGLTLFVVGSWVACAGVVVAYYTWKRAHRGEPSPLFAFVSMATVVLWFEATIGVAIEALLQLIPWSLGWEKTIDVELSRTLFWYFGHPLVYFWLLPAYIAWYINIPKIAGGKTFSDTMTRLSFILLVIFSVPVGVHHQLMESGIQSFFKYVQVALTYCVVIPSLMTAFAVAFSMEQAGRARGGRGWLGWMGKLPWADPSFLAPAAGMLTFIIAGAGGIVNASAQMDAEVHNTLWVVGHFHLTLATSVVLTYFGITYWMLPMITGKKLWMPALACSQTVVWIGGMILMSGAMHIAGLLGDPRRTASTSYGGSAVSQAWDPYMTLLGLGGMLLGLGVAMFLAVVIGTIFNSEHEVTEFPVAEIHEGGLPTPPILERWGLWIGISMTLAIIAYAGPIGGILSANAPGSKGFDTWGGATSSSAAPVSPPAATVVPGQISFVHDVYPIFQAHCAACHIAAQSGGLALNSYAALQKGGDIVAGSVFKPGDHAGSILWQILQPKGPWPGGAQMPLGGPYLSADQLQTIAKWIDQGAKNN